jgi:hypothetical protein
MTFQRTVFFSYNKSANNVFLSQQISERFVYYKEHMRFRTNFSFLARLLADRVRNEANAAVFHLPQSLLSSLGILEPAVTIFHCQFVFNQR